MNMPLPAADLAPIGECVFCGGKSGSKEHVFPDWLNNVFPRSAIGKVTVTLDNRSLSGDSQHREFKSSKAANLITKEVCHDCNTGWMSTLERKAKPLMVPMLTGVPTGLSESSLLILSAWATKTAITLELSSRTERDFTNAHCSFLRQNEYPPEGVSVYAAIYSGDEEPFTYFHGQLKHHDREAFIGFHTIQVGNLVLQVCVYDPPDSNHDLLALRPLASKYDGSVYPPTSDWKWPQAGNFVLDDGSLEQYAKRHWELGITR